MENEPMWRASQCGGGPADSVAPMRRGLWLALGVVVLAACESTPVHLEVQAPATWQAEPGGYERAVVIEVVDGDTVVARVTATTPGPGAGATLIGRDYRVRLIGIDTPESVDPRSEVECFGREAAAAAKALLEGRTVRLVKDVSEEDRFGRLVRYVYFGDEMANARLVANGYAYAFTYPPDVRHTDLFVSLQAEARAARRGLWAPSTCNGQP
jgi:micrococcal nuclease